MSTKEILFLETSYSCAYCGIRQIENLTIHHIDGNPQNNKYDNQIVLCHNCHHRCENKKGISLKNIKEKKKILIYKTLTQYGVNALKMAYRNDFGIIALPFLLYHLVDMGYMTKQEEQMGYGDGNKYTEVTVRFEITSEGKALYEKWFK